jgi:hypothetical protein
MALQMVFARQADKGLVLVPLCEEQQPHAAFDESRPMDVYKAG